MSVHANNRLSDNDERLNACMEDFDSVVAPVVNAEFLRLRQRGYEKRYTETRRTEERANQREWIELMERDLAYLRPYVDAITTARRRNTIASEIEFTTRMLTIEEVCALMIERILESAPTRAEYNPRVDRVVSELRTMLSRLDALHA